MRALLRNDETYYLAPHIVPIPNYDFSRLDERLQGFVAESGFDGASIAVIDADLGLVHERAVGAFSLDTIVPLASASKVPSATLLMALDGDPKLRFDVDTPIWRYLPWEGHYVDATVGQLLSNTEAFR